MGLSAESFLLFCKLAYLFSLTPIIVSGFQDGDCYGNETLPLFQYAPGAYEPETETIRPEVCSRLCADNEMPVSAIVSRQYCLCAYGDEIEALNSTSPLPQEVCEAEIEGTLRVYRGVILTAVDGLQLSASPEIGFTDELSTFEVSIKAGVDVQFMLDFGDGSPETEWNSSHKFNHNYHGSGLFRVLVYARQQAKPERRARIASMTYKVVDKLEPIDIDFRCFPVIEPEEDSGCNVTLLAGQDVRATVEFGDGSDSIEFEIPDSKFNPLGPEIFDNGNVTYDEAPNGLYILSDSAKSYQSHSNIRAIEGFALQAGRMELIVYRPFCGNNTPCSLGLVACSPPKVFCLRGKNCVLPTPAKPFTDSSECRAHIDIFPEYKVVRRVLVTVTNNYFYYRLSKSRDFRIGDLIALKLYEAKIALRSAGSSETADLRLKEYLANSESEPPKIIGYEQLKPINGQKLQVRVISYENSEFYLPHQYIDNGDYTVKLIVTSPWILGNFTYNMNIAVQTPIDRIRLRVVPPNAAVNQKVTASIRINGGSDVMLTWDFGDGYKTNKKVDYVRAGQKFSEIHQYRKPGVYKISVGASNLQNKYQTNQIISAQYPITNDWALSTNSPQLLPGTVDVTLSYPQPNNWSEMVLPTNGSVNILFGDGSTLEWLIPDKWSDFSSGEKIFSHEYRHPGHYKVIVTMLNLVSSLTLKSDIFLLRRIVGFTVTTQSLLANLVNGKKVIEKTSRSKGIPSPISSTNGHKLPINSLLEFNFNQIVGDVDKYIVFLNENSIKETKDSQFLFTGKQPGWHNFTFYAYNKIQGRSEPINQSYYFMKLAAGLEVSDISNDTFQVSNFRTFRIRLDEPGTDTCVMIKFGDLGLMGDRIEAFGENETCAEAFPGVEFSAIGELAQDMYTSYEYPGAGEYQIKVKAWNSVSGTLSAETEITILEIDCNFPEVMIYNAAEEWLNATEIWRSKPVQLYSLATIDCNATVTVSKYWQCLTIDNETGVSTNAIDLSSLDSYRKTLLYVPPFFLPDGLYEFRFVVNLTNQEPHPLLPFHSSASTYIRVVRSPIIGKMTRGAESRAIRGWGQKLRLSPSEYSLDPDDESNKNFNITWFCRRLPSEKIMDQAEEELTVSEPLWERPVWMEDQGGCFGKGPGRINITGGTINWLTSVFMKAGFTYELIARIDPPDRESSWTGIQLVLLDRSPPSITIQCQVPSLCYPHIPLGQKINPVRVGLVGICAEDCDGTLIYEWSIYGVDVESGDETHLSDAAQYIVGANEVKMALGKEFFDRYYPKYGDFSAKLSVINEQGDRGESDIFLHINKPPTGGDCNITSTGRLALLDKHFINCYNWYDPEFKPIEYYAFWIWNRANDAISFLSYGPERKASLILPYGDFMVGVDIRDREGALTRVPIANLSLIAPTQQQFDAFMELKQLENADAAGDQSRMNMISQAISSLMNIDLIDENLLTTTTTTTTTARPTNATYAVKSEAKLEEEARTRSKMVQSVESIMNVDTLTSLEQVGSVLSAIAGRGKGVDNEAKEVVIRLLNKTINMASSLEVESPQQLIDFCMFAVGTMGAIVNRMTEQLIKKVVLPTDRSKAWEIEYNVEPPDYGESKDYIFDGKSSVEESLSKAVIVNERRLGEEQIKQMVGLTIDLVLAILRNIVVGEKPLTFSAPSGLSFTIEMFNGGGLTNKSIKHGDAVYIFPEVCSILTSKENCYGNETLGIMAVSWPSILESFGNSVDLLSDDTQTLQLIVLDESLQIMDISNASDYFSIIVPRGDETLNTIPDSSDILDPYAGDMIYPELKEGEHMQYHQFLVTKAYSAVNIELTPSDPNAKLMLFINYKSKPMLTRHEISLPLDIIGKKIGSRYEVFLGNQIIANRTGFFYLGVTAFNQSAIRESSFAYLADDLVINVNASLDNSTLNENVTDVDWVFSDFGTNYTLRVFTSGCYFFDYTEKIWTGHGCFVHSADRKMTHCKCNHLTSFGSGFFVMPNTIDFSYVFANAGFVDNITIYMTVIITLALYIILVIWARHADRADLKKLGATPLPDNDPKDKYLYEITVYTGDKEGSETDSKVSFILSGDDDETDVRTFDDPERKVFRKGGQDIFVMAVPRKLGRLTYLRIWHDNSGKGKNRSWFMNFIVIRDVQTGEKFEFICNKWFAVEKGDGSIDRLIPVAGLGEATEFSHLFQNKTSKGLKDGHLWFSVFLRPTRSRFTRVQRVSCCMAMLYLSMLVNAMWYEKAPPKPRSSAFEIGPFALSPEQIGIGFMANLIVFPPTFLIVLLFRKSRLRRLRPSRLEEAAKRQGIPIKKLTETANSPGSGATVGVISTIDKPKDPAFNMEPKKRVVKKVKKSRLFPWWCRYIGWALCLLCIVVSVFFLWAYGIQFGDAKTRKWLTSLVISFFASVLITQPIKVFLTAMILSTLFKSPDADFDESEEDEEEINLQLAPDEQWLHDLAKMSPSRRARRSKYYRPPNLSALELAKLERLKEIQMGIILKDIFSYLLFLWLLIVLSYGNRDPNAYLLKDTVKSMFIDGANSKVAFDKISTTESFWNWAEKTLIPELLVGPWYNNYQPYGLRGFLNDRVNRIMGYGVLRSTRIRQNTCDVLDKMKPYLVPDTPCRDFSNLLFEDRKSYDKGWNLLNVSESKLNQGNRSTLLGNTVDYDDEGDIEDGVMTKIPGEDIVLINPSKSKKTPWEYRKPSELDGLPFWGRLDVYSGGGYTIPLRGSRSQLTRKLTTLKDNNWIDARTRSVFAEFSVYNPQVNLFSVVTIVAEFQPGGGIIPNYRIDVVRLIRYHQGFGLFVILCELSYIGFIIYFTVREIKKLRIEGFRYFTSYWNWAEQLIINFSYVAIGLYVYRTILTYRILKIFDKTHGNGYIKLQYAAFIDELFGYIMAFVMFIGILKFIRLLRFNKRMGLLYMTLNQCSKDLKSFCIVFLIVFFAFVQLFYLLFGASVADFSSFVNAAETSFGMVTGKFDFDAMCQASPFLGPAAFFIFVLIAQIILVNIFLTLIISAFETVKHDIMKQSNDFELVSFTMKKIKEILGLDGHDTVHPSSTDVSGNSVNSVQQQLKLLPDKIDALIAHIDEVFYGGQGLISARSRDIGTAKLSSRSKYADLMSLASSGVNSRANITNLQILESPNNEDRLSSLSSAASRRRGQNQGGRRSRRLTRDGISYESSFDEENMNQVNILDWREISNK